MAPKSLRALALSPLCPLEKTALVKKVWGPGYCLHASFLHGFRTQNGRVGYFLVPLETLAALYPISVFYFFHSTYHHLKPAR